MDGYLKAMRNYAGFTGRASRAEFWQFVAVLTAMFIVLKFLTGSPRGGSIWNSFPSVLLGLVHFVPSLAVSVRRLHDADYSGWWAVVNVIPLGNFVMLAFGCVPGTSGSNRYGPEPLAATGRLVPGAPNQAPPVAPQRDVIAEIERLAQLRAAGSLSDAEFAVMKAQALREGRVG